MLGVTKERGKSWICKRRERERERERESDARVDGWKGRVSKSIDLSDQKSGLSEYFVRERQVYENKIVW